MPSAKRCVRRSLRIKVRRAKDPVTRLTVRVNGRRRAASRGKSVTVRRLPRKRFGVQVEVRTRSGHVTAGQRTYRRC
jgi:hypothetical protein